jgi:hypothetical protein
MSKVSDEVISEILIEMDKEYAEYQRIYKKFHFGIDSEAKNIYSINVSLCEEFRRRILAKES